VLAGHKLVELLENISEKDLVVCLVSGGGSALLCWPEDEYTQGKKLYEDFLKTGGDIKELNTVRKHLSSLKGGGLAKMLYPATVATLVFSDVPGNSWSSIASGPTYKDQSTIQDAQSVLDKYKLSGFKLSETPKEDKYFEKIYNFQAVSNITLLSAMKKSAESLNIPCNILSSEIYSDAPNLLESFLKNIRPGEILLGAGEMKVTVTKTGGTGGRCQYLGMQALNKLKPNDTFAALSSDGLDNSDVAGIILDSNSSKEALNKNLNVETYLENFNGYEFFKQLGKSQVFTGATEANVSDFYIFYRNPQD
jgi:glycerate-2-kinase